MNIGEWRESGEYFDHGGYPIFFRRDGNAGDVLLCLHGFPTSSFDYHKIWTAITNDFHVIAFDMLGYGNSAKPADADYTTNIQVDTLLALLRHLKIDRLHILSHDYGNTIVQELLARINEGSADLSLRSICFMNGALFPETHRPILAQKLLISPNGAVFGRFVPDGFFKKGLRSVFGSATAPSDRELDDHVRLFTQNGGKKIAHKLIRYMTERTVYRERWLGSLQKMPVPFRFINGLADPVSGAHLVRRFRELLPELQDIVELPAIGHFPHLECPNRVIDEFRAFHRAISE